MTMTPEKAAQLRHPFEPQQIGMLPKPYKADSVKGNCKECGGYHGLPAVHLDYVGHAATTDRLLQVDPSWTWEPLALDDKGLPVLDRDGNLWIKLTVCGVTRLGVGDGKSMKERIGDAIRNAAMRFGVALDLWAKEDLKPDHHQDQQPASKPPAREEPAPQLPTDPGPPIATAKARVWEASKLPMPKGKDESRRDFILKALIERGYDANKSSDLNDLAAEWELAK